MRQNQTEPKTTECNKFVGYSFVTKLTDKNQRICVELRARDCRRNEKFKTWPLPSKSEIPTLKQDLSFMECLNVL